MSITPDILAPYVAKGLVSARTTDGLTIYNYTPSCTYSRGWDAVTLQARGLVFDDTGRLRARPWGKFFNLGEPECPTVPTNPPDDITIKHDGSLGIGFVHAGRVRWSTRGSLESPQAAIAQRIWDKSHASCLWVPLEMLGDLTLLVEILSPEIDSIIKADADLLILLGARVTSTGRDLSRAEIYRLRRVLKMEATEKPSLSFDEAHAHIRTMSAGEEGYVARWGSTRIKLKSVAYLAVARLVQGMSERRVGDLWVAGEPLPTELPEETRMWAEGIVSELGTEERALLIQGAALAARYDTPKALAVAERKHPAFHVAVKLIKGMAADARPVVYRRRFGCQARVSP